MTTTLPLTMVDVFSDTLHYGNPVAVVQNADDLTDDQMEAFTRWTNLSECAFLVRPTSADADYRVRIFAPGRELRFAGHPTLGACHAWLAAGGTPKDPGLVVQECGAGLIPVRRESSRLAFAAPAIVREGPIFATELDLIVDALGIPATAVVDHRVLDNGPIWHVLLLDSADRTRGLRPDFHALRAQFPEISVGVVGMERRSRETAIEVRGFALSVGIPEDPVTGSLNAVIAQWLIGADQLPQKYVAAQGGALGRTGRVYVEQDPGKRIWIGGHTTSGILGSAVF